MVKLARQRAPQQPRPGVSPARRVAFRTVRRVFADEAWADHVFRTEAERAALDPRDRAFAQQLAYGTIQRKAALDYVLSSVASRPVGGIDPALRDLLRLGFFQLLYLGGVPDHAAVNQTVEMAKAECERGHRFANALMRRAARQGRELLRELTVDRPSEAAILHSHPEWLVRLWWDVLGARQALSLLERDNAPAESALRVNGLLVTVGEVARSLGDAGVRWHAAPGVPEGMVLDSPYDVHGSPLWAAGAVMPQSRASMLVARVLEPRPGERVLDLCAAPGGKTTHIAALMEGAGEVVAVERNPARSRQLADTCRRMGAAQVRVLCGDAVSEAPDGPFDRVLLDPPCSDLGTLQARPDARWRKTREQMADLAETQAALLAAAASRVRPGGVLVYSTCTISPRENEEQLRAFLAARPEWSADDLAKQLPDCSHAAEPRFLQLLPHVHGTDGFFIARLRRAVAADGDRHPR
jgi:16S rRNA (cytosine967-C5)-methyltransferase